MSDDKKVYRFDGGRIDVTWDGRLCIHVSECTRAKGGVFVSGRNPWATPDVAEAGAVAEIVERCPTGALAYRRKDGGRGESPASLNTVVVSNNGPLYVRGELHIEGAGGDMPGVRYRAALCRCGASKTKPFCDNSHEGIDFRERGSIGETGEGFDAPGGPLEIKLAKNGPLLLQGSFTMLAGSARPAWRGTKAALCRCGASANKPFCDGSHKTAGFRSD